MGPRAAVAAPAGGRPSSQNPCLGRYNRWSRTKWVQKGCPGSEDEAEPIKCTKHCKIHEDCGYCEMHCKCNPSAQKRSRSQLPDGAVPRATRQPRRAQSAATESMRQSFSPTGDSDILAALTYDDAHDAPMVNRVPLQDPGATLEDVGWRFGMGGKEANLLVKSGSAGGFKVSHSKLKPAQIARRHRVHYGEGIYPT